MEPFTPIAAATAVGKASTALGGMKSGADLVESISRLKHETRDFKPDVKDLRIDHLNRTVRMVVLVHAPASVKRLYAKIRVPSDGFQFREVRNSVWELVPDVLVHDGPTIVCKASALPDSHEDFFFIFEGALSEDALANWVEVGASADPSDDSGQDVYWLASALSKPELMERIYHSVQIEKVNVSVQVTLQRYFFTSLPAEIHRGLVVREQMFRGAQLGNRDATRKAEYSIRRMARRRAWSDVDLMKVIGELISQDVLRSHVSVSEPFSIVSVNPEERRTSLIPERFGVSAGTTLSYSQKVARGTLRFRREDYKKSVRDRVDRLIPAGRVDDPQANAKAA